MVFAASKILQCSTRAYIVDILKDGSLDLKDETLGQMDCVIASVHMNTSMGKEDMTQRVINAIKTGKVNILGHPTGRLINKR